jgi:hypothetical protein
VSNGAELYFETGFYGGMKRALLSLAATAVMLVGCEKKAAEIQKVQQPALALPKVRLVGITTILGNKRALLNVELPGNSPGPTQSLTLSEHQKSGQVEVLEIDQKSASVRVSNAGVVTLLTLERPRE